MSYFKDIAYTTGEITELLMRVIKSLKYIPRHRKLIIFYMYEMSGSSLFILLFAAMFIGMVSAYQAAYQLKDYLPLVYVSTLVTQAVLVEIGPLLTGIAFAGKVSSSTAAELASMKISDQIDALEVMSIDSVEYLVMPRIVAAVLIIPFLGLIANFTIVMGAFIISIFGLNITVDMFIEGSKKNFYMFQVFGGLIKVMFFGFATLLLSCYYGITAKAGSKSVGKATTMAVITTSMIIVVLDYILTRLLFIW